VRIGDEAWVYVALCNRGITGMLLRHPFPLCSTGEVR
jgi:hypothetical protein